MRVLTDILASVVLATATALPTDQITQWLDIVKDVGVVVAILAYFVIRDYLRYQADQKEKVAMRLEIRNLTNTLITGYSVAMQDNQETIIKAERTHKTLISKYHIQVDEDSTREVRKQR